MSEDVNESNKRGEPRRYDDMIEAIFFILVMSWEGGGRGQGRDDNSGLLR